MGVDPFGRWHAREAVKCQAFEPIASCVGCTPNGLASLLICAGLVTGVDAAIAQTTYRVQHNSGTTVATGITTNAPTCGDQPEATVVTLLSTSAFDCGTDRIEAPAGQVIFDAYVGTAYAQNTAVTGGSFSMRIRSNGATSTVSAQLFSADAAGTRTFIGSAVNSPSISNEATYTLNLSSQSATVPAGSTLGLRLRSNGPEFRWFWGSSYGVFGGTLVVTETSASATTTLGNGTDPLGANLAPGAAATFADAFTFQTSSGTDTITAVTVAMAAGSANGLGLIEITDDGGGTVYGSATNPSSDLILVSLTSPITATATATQFRIRVTPKSHAVMPVPTGSTYTVTARVSSWTGTNTQAGSDAAGTTVSIDNLSPANVSAATATSASTRVALVWFLPSDADLAHVVVLRRAGSAVSDVPSEGVSYVAGAAVGSSVVACVVVPPMTACDDDGLANGTAYHYRVFARDTAGNYAIGAAPGGSPATPAAGISVTPVAGLVTSESGTSATFTVVLTSQPTADVTVALATSDATEGTVIPASLTFTSANWNTPQTTTVTGIDDLVADGNRPYVIQTAPAVSADQGYLGLDPADVAASNADDDIAGISITPTSGLTTSEAGASAAFSIVLNSMPIADVTIALSSSDISEATVAPVTVTFTPSTWNAVQTVTVTGLDDAAQDGEQTFSVVTAEAVSADPLYAGVDPADVLVRNADDDTAAIAVTPTAGLVTTESGGSAVFRVALTSQPEADVIVTLSSSDATEGTVAPASVTFTASNWSEAQAVTATGLADGVDDGDVGYTIVTSASSADPAYDGVDVPDVGVVNVDADAAGVVVAPTTGHVTTEAGATTTFTVVLTSQPAADVRIDLSASDDTEGSVVPASLIFGAATWQTPQTVTVSGVDDAWYDGPVTFTVITTVVSPGDQAYAAIDPVDVSVTNVDDDVPGVTVTPTGGVMTTEAGGTTAFVVALTATPTADVTIALSSTNAGEGLAHPESLTFSSATWNVPQTVTVTGVDDAVADGSRTFTIVTSPVVSADPSFAGIDPPDVDAVNVDDDRPGITVSPTTGLMTSEAGRTAQFTIVLNTAPVGDVTMAISSSDVAEATVQPPVMRFARDDWSVAQTVTLTGIDDRVADGSKAYVVTIAPAASEDGSYDGLDADDVNAVNVDDDTPGVSVTPVSGLVTSERGGSATFTMVLNTRPSSDVTISLASSRPDEGTAAPGHVRFTPIDWNVSRTITVSGIGDSAADGAQLYRVTTGPAVSADTSYSGLDPADVHVTNLDDDLVGLDVVASRDLTTTEVGGTIAFRVALRTRPRSAVDVPIASSNTSEGVVSPALLTFTPDDWDLPVTVTVRGVDDGLQDGSVPYRVAIGPALSGDASYQGARAPDLLLTNLELVVGSVHEGGGTSTMVRTEVEASAPRPVPADDGSTVVASAERPAPTRASSAETAAAVTPTVESPTRQPVPALVVAPPSQPVEGKPAAPDLAAEPAMAAVLSEAPAREERVDGRLPVVHNIEPRRAVMNTALEMSQTRKNAIVVSDPDGLDHYVVVSLVARNGSVTLAATTGLWFAEGAPVGASAMTFKGTVAAVNAALDGLQFSPDRSFVGEAGLCIDASHPPRRPDLPSLCVDRVEAVWPDATDGPRMAVWVPIQVEPRNDPPALAVLPEGRHPNDTPAP